MGNSWRELDVAEQDVEVDDVSLDLVEDEKKVETDKVDTSLDEKPDQEAEIKALKRKERLAKQKYNETTSVASEIAEQNRQLQAELQKERARKAQSEKEMYKNVAKELDSAVSALQDQLEQALATSDYKKAAELNVKIQKAVVKQQAYEAVSEEESQEEVEEEQKPQRRQQQPQKQSLPPQLEDWLDDNPWFHRPGLNDDEADKKKTRVAVRISDELLREGYSADEDDFYQELSERLEKETKKVVAKATPNTQPQKGAQGGVIRRDGKLFVKPTADDVNMAKRLGLYDPSRPELFKKYMRNKIADQNANGQYVDIEI